MLLWQLQHIRRSLMMAVGVPCADRPEACCSACARVCMRGWFVTTHCACAASKLRSLPFPRERTLETRCGDVSSVSNPLMRRSSFGSPFRWAPCGKR